jgi:mRNA-degrading endonuclease toxin of MazEF toxin-antitoxin module
MGLVDEIAQESHYFNNSSLIERVKNQIIDVKKFIKKLKIGQYFVVYVDFGEKLTQNKNLLPRNPNDLVSIKEMFESKGYNCGFNEFRYTHMAVILSSIHHKYLLSKRDKHYSVLVAPISSNSKRIIHSISLEKRLNNWLDNDSYILLDNITHISLEKINISKTKNLYKNNQNIPIQIASEKVKEIKTKLKIIFDI